MAAEAPRSRQLLRSQQVVNSASGKPVAAARAVNLFRDETEQGNGWYAVGPCLFEGASNEIQDDVEAGDSVDFKPFFLSSLGRL